MEDVNLAQVEETELSAQERIEKANEEIMPILKKYGVGISTQTVPMLVDVQEK